jgi:hypothetical protein
VNPGKQGWEFPELTMGNEFVIEVPLPCLRTAEGIQKVPEDPPKTTQKWSKY